MRKLNGRENEKPEWSQDKWRPEPMECEDKIKMSSYNEIVDGLRVKNNMEDSCAWLRCELWWKALSYILSRFLCVIFIDLGLRKSDDRNRKNRMHLMLQNLIGFDWFNRTRILVLLMRKNAHESEFRLFIEDPWINCSSSLAVHRFFPLFI